MHGQWLEGRILSWEVEERPHGIGFVVDLLAELVPLNELFTSVERRLGFSPT